MDRNYSQFSVGQARANQAAQELLKAAVKDILSGPTSTASSFSIADIGSSVGNNSISELATVVRCLDEQGAGDREVSVTHVDQLANHWDQLFQSLAAMPGGYPHVRTGARGGPVFSYAIAQDMYQQCFPSASVDLAYSGITFHWSSVALNAPDHIVAQYSAEEHFKQAAEDQGHADLLQWLRMRAKELKPGGHLIATAIGSCDDATYKAIRQIFDLASKSWDKTLAEGHITSSEHASTQFPLYLSDLKECLELVNKELSSEYEVIHSTGGSASKECLAANFVPSTQYILLALRRK
ncbi:hypothetical protein WJX74_004181 [Apatococcus lobatus]|uniref:Uncharacterized protein n=1 Tax=Apatococcus lobatus TaxID=904363 RepID=A0AAW1QTF6_9CHLO